MRVALVVPYAWSVPGGVRSHVAGFVRFLLREGIEAEILAPGARSTADGAPAAPAARLVDLGPTIPILDNGSYVHVALAPRAIVRTARAVRVPRYDLVHVHEPMIPAVSLTALLRACAPLVGTFHMYAATPRWYRVFAPLCRWALRRLDARIAVSEAARWHVARTCPGEYRIIPNGIDVRGFAVSEHPPGRAQVVFLGRAEPRKGLGVLLEAFARLPAHARLDLVGVSEHELRRVAASLPPEVRSRIRAHGYLDDDARARVLAEVDVLCAPSLHGESFGMVLVEAMAAGVPVVASRVPGYVDVLPESCGRLVPPGDPRALAEAVEALLADPELRRALGSAGRSAAARYDWSVVGAAILDVYDDVLRRRAARAVPGELARAPWPRTSLERARLR
ncbi:MAG: glycosyltransferase family 4 protein [Thermoleophilia bacterium]|nr:glycosyltransferase family 4 protein [Thermoleophilia bacterium]